MAKPDDAPDIAAIYEASNEGNEQSFMSKLGPRFLSCYYRIVLKAPSSVVICAVSEAGQIQGFAAGSLDAAEQLALLRQNRLKLLWAALPRLLQQPGLVQRMLARGRQDENEFIITKGVRWEYWAWHPQYKGTNGAMRVHRAWLAVVKSLGASRVSLETNDNDEKLAFLHSSQGAKLVKVYATPEGLKRKLFEYVL
jgi:hypothetical protein